MTNAEVEAFLIVCETGSLSRAAARLYISQSSLSTKLKTLERELGCRLLSRGKGVRGVVLTDEGRAFFPLAQNYRVLIAQMYALGEQRAPRKLRVSSLNSIGTYLFAPVYERFMRARPDVVLEIQDTETDMAYIRLESGRIDLAFLSARLDAEKVPSVPVFTEPIVFVCAADSPYPATVTRAALRERDEVYVGWSPEFIRWHRAAFGGSAAPRIDLAIMSQLQYFLSVPGAWAFVPATVARGLTADGRIVRREHTMELPRRVTYCLYVRNPGLGDVLGSFLDALREVLLELADTGVELCAGLDALRGH